MNDPTDNAAGEPADDRPASAVPPLDPAELHVGARVWVVPWQSHGRICAVTRRGTHARVELENAVIELPAEALCRPRLGAPDASAPKGRVTVRRPPARAVGTELDLHGRRVDEAVAELQTFLDAAMLAGLGRVRIIHGLGTGALCRAIHDYLGQADYVKGFCRGMDGRDPGGAGMTWVFL